MYKIQKGLIIQKINDKTMIFDNKKSFLYTLNKTASEIFRGLKKGFSKEKIISLMMKKYLIKKENLEKDVDFLIKNLLKEKIISK